MPLKALLESDSQQVVDPGTVCFWVQGSSLALPFGPTPVSKGDLSHSPMIQSLCEPIISRLNTE